MLDNLMFKTPPRPQGVISQIKTWVQSALSLPQDATLMISELRCTEANCPPLETVIVVMLAPNQIQKLKIHKALPQVQEADVYACLGSKQIPQQTGEHHG